MHKSIRCDGWQRIEGVSGVQSTNTGCIKWLKESFTLIKDDA